MANIRLVVDSSDLAADLTAQMNNEPAADNGSKIDFFKRYIIDLMSGRKPGSVLRFYATETAASGTAQCATVLNNDTVTIGSKVLTAKTTPTTQDHFARVASNVTTSANLAACINANTDLKQHLSAISDGVDTVTITCLVPGQIGNNIPLASSGATIVLSGSYLASGVDGVFVKKVM